jgi:hypothetical protein
MKLLGRKSGRKTNGRSPIAGKKPFSMPALLKHIDPGPPQEAEEFVRLIYEQRKRDLKRPAP